LKVVDEIERNAMGKVNKKVIVQKYWPDKVWGHERYDQQRMKDERRPGFVSISLANIHS
jgi:hypothetical protein